MTRFGRLRFTAMWTPGHTSGHIVWRLDGKPFNTVDSVFTGDLVMMACCGANFEGLCTSVLNLNVYSFIHTSRRVIEINILLNE